MKSKTTAVKALTKPADPASTAGERPVIGQIVTAGMANNDLTVAGIWANKTESRAGSGFTKGLHHG